MKAWVTYLLVLAASTIAYGQSQPAENPSKADSVIKKNNSTDRVDSLTESKRHKMDSAIVKINFKIDSLQSKGLPATAYKKKLDSVNLRLKNFLSLTSLTQDINKDISKTKGKITAPNDSLQKKVNRKARVLERKLKKKTTRLDSLTAKAKDPSGQVPIPNTGKLNSQIDKQAQQYTTLPGGNTNLPTGGVNPNQTGINTGKETTELNQLNKSLSLSQPQEIKQVESEIKKIETLPQQELKEATNIKEINEAKKELKEVTKAEKQADVYKKEMKDLKTMDKAKADSLQKIAEKDVEKAVTNSGQVKDLTKETATFTQQKNAFEQYKDMVANFNKEGGLKQANEISKKSLTNPFIGQEAKLQAGITQLNTLKKKYGAITDSRKLPKFPNQMRGKPFKERLVPGINFQVYHLNKTGIDLSPYIMYRLTGRLRIGVGGSQRWVVDSKNRNVNNGQVLAIRLMTDIKVIKTWNFHIEEEWTHYDPAAQAILHVPTDPLQKEWNLRLNMGILKTYKISRRIDGQTQILYNTLDWSNFPQGKNTTLRFGFEYKFGVKSGLTKK